MKQILLSLLISTVLFSCEDSDPLTAEEVPSIMYGTSFGFCVGHCITDLEVNSDYVYFSTYGWQDSVSTITKTEDFNQRQYNEILSLIDQKTFLSLDPVIGCPDCADGGSEWIELKVGERTKKVTFEYGATIDGIHLAVTELRRLTLGMTP